MNGLEQFQRRIARLLVALSWLHLPVLGLMSLANGKETVLIVSVAAVGAGLATYFYSARYSALVVGLVLSISLVGDTSLMVYIYSGHPWQVETHFYYFVVLAMISGFCDWRILVINAAVIATHHLVLNGLFPAAIYPGGSDVLRVVAHVSFVAVETAVLSVIGFAIRDAFAKSESALAEAGEAKLALERIASKREKDLDATTMRADQTGEILDRFKAEMERSIEVLHQAAGELQSYTDALNVSAAHAGTQSSMAAEASEGAAREVHAAADAGDELARTIAEVGSNAARSSKLAADAVQQAETTNITIDEMAAVASEIGEVTGLISSIAAQTNLLALNATIEAARAGEAGKGFAVVASEVKALASQTARATQDIASRIEAMQTTTARSVSAIQAITATIRELDQFSTAIAAAVEQQASAAHGISANVNAAAGGVQQMTGAIGDIEHILGETKNAADALGRAAARIADQTGGIRTRVNAFTGDIMAIAS
ncbi:MAG TPA: methyl-accepting chemotaxis protein [Xanthobacteraceae bacterium]|jgi:methyl-accepting chemotaxis protein|nr:methyl-accepting chemotaxis protein [Xanthobacteraceae bacterium]